jgi:hypothetical protein
MVLVLQSQSSASVRTWCAAYDKREQAELSKAAAQTCVFEARKHAHVPTQRAKA